MPSHNPTEKRRPWSVYDMLTSAPASPRYHCRRSDEVSDYPPHS